MSAATTYKIYEKCNKILQNQNMQFKSLSGGFAERLKVAASIYHILLYLYVRSILECHSDILLTVNRHEIHQA